MIWYYNDKEKTKLLWVGAVYKADNWNIYKKEITEQEMYDLWKWQKARKSAECRKLILKNYSQTDQNNILAFGTTEEKNTMSNYIQAMITEFQTNWKDADYSNIQP